MRNSFCIKAISALIALTMLLTLFIGLSIQAFAAADDTIFSFKVDSCVTAAATTENDLGVISWWYNETDDKYYVFLPSCSNLLLTKVWFQATSTVYVNGAPLVSGSPTTAFLGGGEFTLTCDSKNYTVVFMKTSSLPSIFINTASGNMDYINADKENKEAGDMLVLNQSGTIEYDNTLKQIKGRGNNTWKLPKKPYNIKLDSSTNLFGMGKSKNWCLLANYNDLTLLRNQLVYDLAGDAGLPYSGESQSVDLYLNGSYNGTYQVTEKVEIAKTRVNITDLEELTEEANSGVTLDTFAQGGTTGTYSGLIKGTKFFDIANNPADITGGYLLEFEIPDRYPNELSGFVTKKGQPVVLNSPEYASEAQVTYISDYVQQMEDAIYSNTGFNSLGKHYSEYLDVESMAKMFVIQEWSMNLDAGISSFYLYKDKDPDKIHAGPVWDFDIAVGNNSGRFGYDLTNPEISWVRNSRLYKNSIFGQLPVKYVPTILNALYQHSDFVTEVEKVWKENFTTPINSLLNGGISDYASSLAGSATMNAIRWNLYGTTSADTISGKYASDVAYVQNFAEKRTAYLNTSFGLKNEELKVSSIKSQTYTGSEITPEVTVTCLGKTLAKDTDYTVSYSNNTEVGTATVTVTGIGDYGTTKEVSFKILAKSSEETTTNNNSTNSGNSGNSNSTNDNTSSANPPTMGPNEIISYVFTAIPIISAATAIVTIVIFKRKKTK